MAARSKEEISRKAEGKVIFIGLRLFGFCFFASLVTYMVNPEGMAWSSLQIPIGLRWLGTVLEVVGISLLYWALHNLGKNLTDTVVTREKHTLVTVGPYRWVRHPLYVVFLTLSIAFSMVASNWAMGLAAVLAFIVIAARTSIEEEMLVERFGDEYREYMGRTGRFLPRLFR